MCVQAIGVSRFEKKVTSISGKQEKNPCSKKLHTLFPAKSPTQAEHALHPLLKKFRKVPPSSKALPNPWKCSAIALSILLLPTGVGIGLAAFSLLPVPVIGQVVPLPALALTQSFCVFIPLEMLKGVEKASLRKEGFSQALKTAWDSMEVHSFKSFLKALKIGSFRGAVGGVFAIFSASNGQMYVTQPLSHVGGKLISQQIQREKSAKEKLLKNTQNASLK